MKRIAAIALFVAASFITAGGALAQDRQVKATVPFNFTVNSSSMPAGNYTIGSASTNGNILTIADWEKHVHILAMGQPDSGTTVKSGHLVFHKYGDQYFLSEICYAGSSTTVQFPVSKAERRAKAETQEAGLRVDNDVMVALY
jgi:hypothetical protein